MICRDLLFFFPFDFDFDFDLVDLDLVDLDLDFDSEDLEKSFSSLFSTSLSISLRDNISLLIVY